MIWDDMPNGLLHKKNQGERESNSLILKFTFLDHQTSARKVRQDDWETASYFHC